MQKSVGILLISLMIPLFPAWTEPTVVPDPIACVRDLETHFFERSIVNQGLSFYDVREEYWELINQRLQLKSLEVPELMKMRTAYMVPNPLEYPMQGYETARILKEVLFAVFAEAMGFYQVNERPPVDFIFDYIFIQQLPKFVACFGPEAKRLQPTFE